uniref:Peptidyl-prolyl cis-trans isomerase n=1 Tax=Steinernema glaseri TaxID=37863 RepID=A0A1I7YUY2_9BILA
MSTIRLIPPQKPFVRFYTNMGFITIQLFWEQAPRTCENFQRLVEREYYDRTIFHRVIADCMIQGGDPTGTGSGGSSINGAIFADEMHTELKHWDAGIVSMANDGSDTNGSQFFITLAPMQHLDGKRAIFGRVHRGIEVLEDIEQVPTDEQDKPKTDVVIWWARAIDESQQSNCMFPSLEYYRRNCVVYTGPTTN